MPAVPRVSPQSFHPATMSAIRHPTPDRQINELVYELYGLTDEEIALVERGA